MRLTEKQIKARSSIQGAIFLASEARRLLSVDDLGAIDLLSQAGTLLEAALAALEAQKDGTVCGEPCERSKYCKAVCILEKGHDPLDVHRCERT